MLGVLRKKTFMEAEINDRGQQGLFTGQVAVTQDGDAFRENLRIDTNRSFGLGTLQGWRSAKEWNILSV